MIALYDSARLLAERKVDALMGFPPVPQELREKKIGHVIVNSGLDRPWSQYFCCVLAANQEFVRKRPVATKRALRAIMKATHFCSTEPERAARMVAERGYRYEHALQTMKEINYAQWRDYDPEDAVRFYALRLREAGIRFAITSGRPPRGMAMLLDALKLGVDLCRRGIADDLRDRARLGPELLRDPALGEHASSILKRG